MRERLQGFIAGGLSVSLLCAGTVFAKNSTEYIEAVYRNIKVCVDGVQMPLKDANGTSVEPFISNGTTYLPVRAVANAFGKAVYWDDETNTIYLGNYNGNLSYPTSKLSDMKSSLVGQWENTQKGISYLYKLEFFDNGTYRQDDYVIIDKYSVDDNHLTLDRVVGSDVTFTFNIENNKLIIQNSFGTECEFQKVNDGSKKSDLSALLGKWRIDEDDINAEVEFLDDGRCISYDLDFDDKEEGHYTIGDNMLILYKDVDSQQPEDHRITIFTFKITGNTLTIYNEEENENIKLKKAKN